MVLVGYPAIEAVDRVEIKMTHASSSKTPAILLTLTGLGAVLTLACLYAIFVVAPVEARMGIVQKIFYFHVPCAYAMYEMPGTARLIAR